MYDKRKKEADIIKDLQAQNEDLNFEMRGVSEASIEANRIIADKGFQDIGRTEQVLGLSKARTDTRADTRCKS